MNEGNNSITKTTHSTSRGTWSDRPGSLPAFRHGEEPGYEARSIWLCGTYAVLPPVTVYGQLLKNGKCIRAEIPPFNWRPLSSGEFSMTPTNKGEADCQRFYRDPTFQVVASYPLYTNGSITPRARGVRIFVARFCSPPWAAWNWNRATKYAKPRRVHELGSGIYALVCGLNTYFINVALYKCHTHFINVVRYL